MNSKTLIRNALTVLVVFLVLAVFFGLVISPPEEKEEVSFSALIDKIEKEEIKEIIITGSEIVAVQIDEAKIKTVK